MIREGKDLSIISCSRMVNFAEKAAEILNQHNINTEIIDLRTLKP